jgi:hypothetical protein
MATDAELQAARVEGAKAERARVVAILTLPEAKANLAAAVALAISSPVSPDEAKEALLNAPRPSTMAAPDVAGRACESSLGLITGTPASASSPIGFAHDGGEPRVADKAVLTAEEVAKSVNAAVARGDL